MAAVGHDGAVAALEVFDGGVEAMTFHGVGARGTGMVFVEAEAMGPTIKHGSTIIGGNRICGCRVHGRAKKRRCLGRFWVCRRRCLGRFWVWSVCGISTVVTVSASGDWFTEAFFVFCCEEFAELDVGLVGGRAEAPHVASQGEDASGFEQDGG